MDRHRITILLLGTFLCLALTVNGEEKSSPLIPVSRVIPGWAQIRSGKPVKGILLLGGFLGAVTGAMIQNHQGNQAYDRYLECRDAGQITELRRQAERRFRSRNFFLIGTVGVLATHFLDLTLSKKPNAKIQGKMVDYGIHLECRISF